MQTSAIYDEVAIKKELANCYDLSPSPSYVRETEGIYSRVRRVVPEAEWHFMAPYIYNINQLKRDKSAVLLAHNYMTPDIYHGVADFVGDSLQLAIRATEVDQMVIIQCGVHFMAETSKILNPDKKVLIPDSRAGCSLAASIAATDVEDLRRKYPDARVVSYVNTSAEVKAASDACCTSSNIAKVIDAMDSDRVIVTPDRYLAENVKDQVSKELIIWDGSCEVHERFTAQEIKEYREVNPGIKIVAHPECPPEVLAEADFSGSTSSMIEWVKKNQPKKVALITECSMSDNVCAESPDSIEFIKPCNLCPHMKRITLENILWSLHTMTEEIYVDPEVSNKARVAIERMIDISKRPS